jgi:hypothetical protein
MEDKYTSLSNNLKRTITFKNCISLLANIKYLQAFYEQCHMRVDL